jgi:hypothetical protein
MKRNTSYEQALRAALADSAKDENGVLVYNPEAAAPVEAETVYDPTDYRADDLSSREALQPIQTQSNRRVGRKAVTWTLAIGLVTGVAYGTERFVVGEDIDLAVHLQDYGKLPQTIPRVAQETGHNIEAVQQNADMIGKVFNQIFNQGNK